MRLPCRSFLVACAAAALAACATPSTPPVASAAADTEVGQCRLPPQMRHLGQNATYLAAGRTIRTTAGDCRVRGGQFAGGGTGAAVVASGDQVAITIGGDDKANACERRGEIAGLQPTSTLTVRRGPGTAYASTDALKNGRAVFFCDWTADETWVGVVYPDAQGRACGVDRPQPLAGPYTGSCRTGWINARWVRVYD